MSCDCDFIHGYEKIDGHLVGCGNVKIGKE